MFGINSWLGSLKIGWLLPLQEWNFSWAMAWRGRKDWVSVYLLSASCSWSSFPCKLLRCVLDSGTWQRSCISFVDNWCNKCNNQTKCVDSWANFGVDITALVQLEMFSPHKSVSDKCTQFLRPKKKKNVFFHLVYLKKIHVCKSQLDYCLKEYYWYQLITNSGHASDPLGCQVRGAWTWFPQAPVVWKPEELQPSGEDVVSLHSCK